MFFWLLGGRKVKGQKIAQNGNNNCIRHGTYLRNSIAYDHDFWYNCVKLWYLQLFSYFFEIFIFRAVKGGKTAKQPKMKTNIYIRQVPYLRKNIAYDHDFWYTCVKCWYVQVFFYIFVNFSFFRLFGWVKGLKIAQNKK